MPRTMTLTAVTRIKVSKAWIEISQLCERSRGSNAAFAGIASFLLCLEEHHRIEEVGYHQPCVGRDRVFRRGIPQEIDIFYYDTNS